MQGWMHGSNVDEWMNKSVNAKIINNKTMKKLTMAKWKNVEWVNKSTKKQAVMSLNEIDKSIYFRSGFRALSGSWFTLSS